MHRRRDLQGEPLLRGPAVGLHLDESFILVDLLASEEREDLHPRDDVGVVSVEPELVHPVRRAHGGIQPDGVALALAELRTVAVGDQRRADGVNRRMFGVVNQIHAAGEVPPLIAAAGLQNTAVGPVQLEIVEPLKDLVAELRVADPRLRVQTSADRVFLQHGANAVVLADLAKEVDSRQRRRPVQVVDDACGVLPLEAEEALHLAAQSRHPLGNGLARVQGPLGCRSRIAHQAGRSPDQAERSVPRELQPTQQEQLHEVTQVQARRRRVKAAVIRDRAAPQQRAQRLLIGGNVHQTTPNDLVPDRFERRVVRGLQRADGGIGREFCHESQASSAPTADRGVRSRSPTIRGKLQRGQSSNSRGSR